ncbi:MAG: transcription-repair coupling factor [Thermodesulfobacteriota bacterium]
MNHPGTISSCISAIRQRTAAARVSGFTGSDRAYFLGALFSEIKKSLVVVCPDAKSAQTMAEDLAFFLPERAPDVLMSFEPYHILAFQGIGYNADVAHRRISTLYRLLTASRPVLLVTTVAAATSCVIPPSVLSGYAELYQAGEDASREDLLKKLAAGGYASTLLVESPSDFATRGGIVDLFSAPYENPMRMEFYGDTVETIRFFSPSDQRTLAKLPEAVVLPASEAVVDEKVVSSLIHQVRKTALDLGMPVTQVRDLVSRIRDQGRFPGIEAFLPLLYPKKEYLSAYLKDALWVFNEPAGLESASADQIARLGASYEKAVEETRLCIPPAATTQTWEEFSASMAPGFPLCLSALPLSGPEDGGAEGCFFLVRENADLTVELASSRDREHVLSPLAGWIRKHREAGRSVALVCRAKPQAMRLSHLLSGQGLSLADAEAFPAWPSRLRSGVHLFEANLSSGFVWENELLAVATDREIFGSRKQARKPPPARPRAELLDLAGLSVGDFVVHADHGVGRYEGLVTMEVNGVVNDFVYLSYRDDDRLYLPVDRTHLISKYRGVGEAAPLLDKLGGKSWEKVKKRVRKDVEKIAGELLRLYAARKARPGYSFQAPDSYFEEFEAAFSYEETPDQARAISDVLSDMQQPEPMDRLVCGDVGYGKTEVGLRASFLSVMAAKQVAFLAPTTILAEQHYRTFVERYKGYPVAIACLNRFRSPQDQKKIVEDLAAGKVDVIIGTHRLLQKDIAFKDLGLVIIDEEQRFGVAHKEKLKKLRATVDVLALTATPIPRTLNMSLSGIRDISVISTPPEQRRPITTYMCALNDAVIADGIRRELARKGQVFFVHNRIQSIYQMARRVQEAVPEARIGVIHGRLPEEELEKEMMSFVSRETDVLVCTSIIESGLDIQSANTIMINRADMFGLAQIYQLRGRVGRSEEQAFAYLFIPDESLLSRDAQRRLMVLMEHSDLGAGFQIAMSDLSIRGGGTILGGAQSGQVAAVGFDMYLSLLEEAIAEIKGEKVEEPLEPEINLDSSALLPDSYIPDMDQRLSFYRKLSRITELTGISEFSKELSDRFGKLPREAGNLLYKMMLKILAKEAGVRRLDMVESRLSLFMSGEHQKRPTEVLVMVSGSGGRMVFGPDGSVRLALTGPGVKARVMQAKNVLKEIAARVN